MLALLDCLSGFTSPTVVAPRENEVAGFSGGADPPECDAINH